MFFSQLHMPVAQDVVGVEKWNLENVSNMSQRDASFCQIENRTFTEKVFFKPIFHPLNNVLGINPRCKACFAFLDMQLFKSSLFLPKPCRRGQYFLSYAQYYQVL